MSRLRQLKGFTLIELIVVVIIIGVLAAIAAVAYNQFVTNARSTAGQATAIQIDKAIVAKSAQDDLTPSAEIKAAAGGAAASNKFGAYFGVPPYNSGTLTYTTDNATTPTVVQVTSGTRPYCLTLGAASGQNATITAGACATAAAAALN